MFKFIEKMPILIMYKIIGEKQYGIIIFTRQASNVDLKAK